MPAAFLPVPLVILSALAQEQRGLAELLASPVRVPCLGREFVLGTRAGRPVLLALSRIGKVAAATTAAALIERFHAKAIVFTGVAGGLGEGVRIGDAVLAERFVQHDMDASPLFARYEVPLYGRAEFPTDPQLTQRLARAAQVALQGFSGARLHRGLVASGDRFVSTAGESNALRAALPEALAVEMEGAAVAQVCHDYGLPFAAVRLISDRADNQAHIDFSTFANTVAGPFAQALLRAWYDDPAEAGTPPAAADSRSFIG